MSTIVCLDTRRKLKADSEPSADLTLLNQTLSCEGCGLKHTRSIHPEAIGPFHCPWCRRYRAQPE